MPQPGSSSRGASSASSGSRRPFARPDFGLDASPSENANPQAAVVARIATPAKAKASRVEPTPPDRPVSALAALSSASPVTPPRPVGSGQRAVGGSALATAVAAPAP